MLKSYFLLRNLSLVYVLGRGCLCGQPPVKILGSESLLGFPPQKHCTHVAIGNVLSPTLHGENTGKPDVDSPRICLDHFSL